MGSAPTRVEMAERPVSYRPHDSVPQLRQKLQRPGKARLKNVWWQRTIKADEAHREVSLAAGGALRSQGGAVPGHMAGSRSSVRRAYFFPRVFLSRSWRSFHAQGAGARSTNTQTSMCTCITPSAGISRQPPSASAAKGAARTRPLARAAPLLSARPHSEARGEGSFIIPGARLTNGSRSAAGILSNHSHFRTQNGTGSFRPAAALHPPP